MNKKKLVILSGAGISKESGIDTFRDKDGLWKKHDALKLASIEGWNEDPQAVLDFYNARRRQLLEVQPNKAHELLAELEDYYDVTIITQNVDIKETATVGMEMLYNSLVKLSQKT